LFAATARRKRAFRGGEGADKLKIREKDVQQWICFARGLIDFSPDSAAASSDGVGSHFDLLARQEYRTVGSSGTGRWRSFQMPTRAERVSN
jgi:hypothetical protein